MGLAGRLRAARPLHAGRKTRPLRRRRRTGNEDSVTQRDRTVLKTTQYFPPALFQGETHINSPGETAEDRYTRATWPAHKEDISLSRKPLRHATCIHYNAATSLGSVWTESTSGHRAGSACEVTCPELATLDLIWCLTSGFATQHLTSISLFLVTVKSTFLPELLIMTAQFTLKKYINSMFCSWKAKINCMPKHVVMGRH